MNLVKCTFCWFRGFMTSQSCSSKDSMYTVIWGLFFRTLLIVITIITSFWSCFSLVCSRLLYWLILPLTSFIFEAIVLSRSVLLSLTRSINCKRACNSGDISSFIRSNTFRQNNSYPVQFVVAAIHTRFQWQRFAVGFTFWCILHYRRVHCLILLCVEEVKNHL